ncbi:MAG: methionyl-tRNA formyltransferase, partial [Clostridiales bacterium]|nr:methionyl-tRNA formyltransferase [Clostridiales bacterium]
MKVLFMGTPEFAVGTLKALIKSSHAVVGVVTQPDRSVKHGKTEEGAVKKVALAAGIPVFQPCRIRNEVDEIKRFDADIAVTAAYGQILTAEVLDAFKYGVINVHASLLPKYRGASPIQAAIAAGETETGVTIMRTELGIDTGDILAVAKTPIGERETAGELSARLSDLGAELLVKTLDEFDKIVPIKQNNELATHCKMISKQELYIDFTADCRDVANKIRALSPLPCAKTVIGGETYKIHEAVAISDHAAANRAVAGSIIRADDKLIVACGSGAVEIITIQA